MINIVKDRYLLQFIGAVKHFFMYIVFYTVLWTKYVSDPWHQGQHLQHNNPSVDTEHWAGRGTGLRGTHCYMFIATHTIQWKYYILKLVQQHLEQKNVMNAERYISVLLREMLALRKKIILLKLDLLQAKRDHYIMNIFVISAWIIK